MDSCRPNSEISRHSRRGLASRIAHWEKFRLRRRERRRLFRQNRKNHLRDRKATRKSSHLCNLLEINLESGDPTQDIVARVPPPRSQGTNGGKYTRPAILSQTTNNNNSNTRRQRKIRKETAHYNSIGDRRSEFAVACLNVAAKISPVESGTGGSRFYELVAEARGPGPHRVHGNGRAQEYLS